MQLKPEEISKIIRAQIKHYENAIEQSETGTVIMVGDGIARASGLEKCMAGELLQFDNGEYGMAQNLEENTVSIVLLGSDAGIKEGSIVKRTGKVVSVPVGDAMIGRVVNALGQPIDGAGTDDAVIVHRHGGDGHIRPGRTRHIRRGVHGAGDAAHQPQPCPDGVGGDVGLRALHRYHRFSAARQHQGQKPQQQQQSFHVLLHLPEVLMESITRSRKKQTRQRRRGRFNSSVIFPGPRSG